MRAMLSIIVLLAFGTLFGCASGQLSTLPKISDIENCATLTVVRENRFMGGSVSARVAIDEQAIAMLRNGTHVTLKVEPGNHAVSFSLWQLHTGGWTVIDRVEVSCLPKQEYFVKFALGMNVGSMESVTREEGLKLIRQTKYLALDQ